ncbi:MAG TPA: ABC transporter permease [Longimicrobiales bacterium]|nr:ABC transporter permease [Longimicrobiales bacterium]
MMPIYLLTLRQLAGRGRLAIMTVLAALPVLITLLNLNDNDAQSIGSFEIAVLGALLAGSIAPLVVLASAGAAFGNELEDRTLANLTISPVPRWKIALPKLLATITVAGPFIALSAFITSYLAFLGEWNAVAATTVSAIAAVAMYASVFTWLGLVSTQAIGLGLLYIVLWEGFFSGFVSGVRLLSIRHYAIGLMHALDERRFAMVDHLNPTVAAVMTTIVIGGFLLLTVRQLRRMDVP